MTFGITFLRLNGQQFPRLSSDFRLKTLAVTMWNMYATSCKRLPFDSLPRVAKSPDSNCFICWHPEPEFPYEYSQPLPRSDEMYGEVADSPLQSSVRQNYELRYRPDGPTDPELCDLFFTTKHQWRPMTMKRYKRVKEIHDREKL